MNWHSFFFFDIVFYMFVVFSKIPLISHLTHQWNELYTVCLLMRFFPIEHASNNLSMTSTLLKYVWVNLFRKCGFLPKCVIKDFTDAAERKLSDFGSSPHSCRWLSQKILSLSILFNSVNLFYLLSHFFLNIENHQWWLILLLRVCLFFCLFWKPAWINHDL